MNLHGHDATFKGLDEGRARYGLVEQLRRLGSANAIVVGTLGAIVAGAVYFADAPFWNERPAFVDTPEFKYWVLLHCAQGALWFVLAAPLIAWLRDLRPYWSGNKARIWSSVAVLLGLIATFVVLSARTEIDYRFPGMDLKIILLAPFPVLLALGGAIGVWLVDAALRGDRGAPPTPVAISRFLELRDRSMDLLLLLALVLASAILNLVALRDAVLAANPQAPAEAVFPKELILLHGTFFSLLLAFGYGPTFLRVRSLGRAMRDELFLVPPSGKDSWARWYEERGAFEKVVELQPGTNPTLRAIAGILSPVATSLLPFLTIG
jgi:hypothetical protein